MACFVVPAAEAIIVSIAAKAMSDKRKYDQLAETSASGEAENLVSSETTGIPFAKKLKWLSRLLWGGSFLLLFEHVWHGEVVPWFPFLSAMADSADTAVMLHEMSTVGVAMALTVTAAWGVMAAVTKAMEKKALQAVSEKE